MNLVLQALNLRKLQSDQPQQNEQGGTTNNNLNQNLDEAKDVINIIVLVIMGICGFIIIAVILYFIRHIYQRKQRSKLLQKQYQQNGSDSQSIQIDSMNNKSDKNNLQKQQSSDNVSINQEMIKVDQTRSQNNTFKELMKDVSSSLENQNNIQVDLNKFNNLNNIANYNNSLQDILKNVNKIGSVKDCEHFDNQNITQLQNKIDQQQEEVMSAQEEANQKKESDSDVFQFDNQNSIIMTPSFNNQQQNMFQFRGSERYSFHNTEESNKTLESLKINRNTGNKTLTNKKKSLYEYNNQVLQPIQENDSRMANRFVSRFTSDICKNQFLDFNQFQQLTEEQKRQKQEKMKSHLINNPTNKLQQQIDKTELNQAKNKNPIKDEIKNKENKADDKENQYPINQYRCLNYPNGLKYMREHVSQVFEEKIE